jgi:hypothetical protein
MMISRRKALLQTAAHAVLIGTAAAFVVVGRAIAAQKVGSAKDVVNQAWGTPPDEGRAELAAASPVHRNELLETGEESAVEVVFVDESKITMGQSARITVDEFVYADPATSKSVINLTKGAFRYVSGKMAEDKVTLKTPTATMVIRGTELKIDVADDGQTEVSVVEGAIEMTSLIAGTALSIATGQSGLLNGSGIFQGGVRNFIHESPDSAIEVGLDELRSRLPIPGGLPVPNLPFP